MTEDNRSVNLGGSADSSAIITGDRNTAIIINYHYYYRENIKVIPVESTDNADENIACPYRGLFRFEPEDAEFFFGREVFVEEMFEATHTRNFIPVLGASGSGKSSVVLAGLVPKLQQEGHWIFTHLRPGSDTNSNPFLALARALVPLYEPGKNTTEQIYQARQLAKYLVNGDLPLQDVLSQIQRNYANHRVLLIVDQFEELYTLCADRKIRHHFLDTLLASFQSSSQSEYNHVLVTTMRADFLENALSYRPFGDVLENYMKLIGSMNHDQLKSIISKPAQKLGVTFELGLVDRILDDVEREPGNLPLLEFALTELWKQRKGKLLTHAAYHQIGKVQGALTGHADRNYSKFSAAQKEQVRRIFIQLVYPVEGTRDTRRMATKAELGEASWELVKQLADSRLVVTNKNADDQETVEVVHETLIHNWEQFQQWMDGDRSFRVWQESLRFAMVQWQKVEQDKGALLRGKVLATAEEQLKQRREELNPSELEFIQASVALQQRRKWQIYLGSGGFASIVLIAIGFWGWLNYIPSGQLTQMNWKLTDVSQQTTDSNEQTKGSEYKSEAAMVFAKNENYAQALELANLIKDSKVKANTLTAIVEFIGKSNQPKIDAPLLKQVITSVENISDSPRNKAEALTNIAIAHKKLNQPQEASKFLKQAITSVENISNSQNKAQALNTITEVITKLNQPKIDAPLLKQAISSVKNISDSPRNKAEALTSIAIAYNELNQPQEAGKLLEQSIISANNIHYYDRKAVVLNPIIEVIAKLKQPQEARKLLEQVITSANNMRESRGYWEEQFAITNTSDRSRFPSYDKFSVLKSIAIAYDTLNQPQEALKFLEQAITSADNIDPSPTKAEALNAITELIVKLNQPQQALQLLEQAITSANKIEHSNDKFFALSRIAIAYDLLNQPQEARKLLEKAITSANNIENKFFASVRIAIAYDLLNQPQEARKLLEQAITYTENISDSKYKAQALIHIAKAYNKLDQPQEAVSLLKKLIVYVNKEAHYFENTAPSLSDLVFIIGKFNLGQEAPRLLEEIIAAANITSDDRALSAILQVISKLKQPQEVRKLLEKVNASAESMKCDDGPNFLEDSYQCKTDSLRIITEVAANLKNWGQALKATEQCPTDDCKVNLLTMVLTIHAEQKNPELKEEEEERRKSKFNW